MTNNLITFQPVNACVPAPLSVAPIQASSVIGGFVEIASFNRVVNTGQTIPSYPTVIGYPMVDVVPATSDWRTRGTNGMTADLQPAVSNAATFTGITGAAAVQFEAVGGVQALGSVSVASAAKQAHAKATKSAQTAAKRGAPPRRIPDLIP